MRFLLYLNMVAIVWLAGALVQIYEGTPLPGHKTVPGPVAEAAVESARESPPAAAPVFSAEEMAALGLPLANPERRPEPDVPAPLVAAVPSLVILTEGEYPPFNYRDDDGTLKGFDVDLAVALCGRLGAECSIVALPWPALAPALRRGEGDAVIASMLLPVAGRGSAAGEGIIFTRGYYSTPGRFAARRSDMPPAATPAALAGRRIGVQAGSAHQAFAAKRFPAAELVLFPGPAEAQKALAAGQVDLVFADRNALLRWVSDKEGSCCRLVGPDYADPAYFGYGAGIALREGDEELRDRLNAALASLVSDGTYARISARYFSTSIF